MRVSVVVAALALAVPAKAQSRAADESVLRARVAAFETAYNKRDATALGALYAMDADLIVVDGPTATGRAAIIAASQRDWASGTATRRISLTGTSIRFVGPDVAVINTRARFE